MHLTLEELIAIAGTLIVTVAIVVALTWQCRRK